MIKKKCILLVYLRYQYNRNPKSLVKYLEKNVKSGYGAFGIFQDIIDSLEPYWTK